MIADHQEYDQRIYNFLKPIKDAGYDPLHVNSGRNQPSLESQLRDYYGRALELEPKDYLLDLLEDGEPFAHPFKITFYCGNDQNSPVIVFHCKFQYPELSLKQVSLTMEEKTFSVQLNLKSKVPPADLMVELHRVNFPHAKAYKSNREFSPGQQINRKSL